MAAARNKHITHRHQAQQQQQHVKKRKKVYDAWEGLRSVESEKQYKWHFNTFMKWARTSTSSTSSSSAITTKEQLLDLEHSELERLIIEYISEHMHKQRQLRHSTINTAMATLSHFCVLNDVWLNTKKISRFIPPDEDHIEDRHYTREEIAKLLNEADPRYKVVILLLVNGLRIGAVPELQLRDLTAKSFGTNGEILEGDMGSDKVYKIWVYNRSKKDRYYSFVTPETARCIDDYLQFRADHYEDMTKGESPLIREQFNVNNRKEANNPHKLSIGTIEKTLERMLKRAGIKTTREVQLTNGFRKYAITMMSDSGVDYDIREYLVGHKISRGLDVHYDRTHENVRLQKWSRAINKLTINEAYHLEKKLKVVEGETQQEIVRLRQVESKQAQEIDELNGKISIVVQQMKEMNNVLGQMKERTIKTIEGETESYNKSVPVWQRNVLAREVFRLTDLFWNDPVKREELSKLSKLLSEDPLNKKIIDGLVRLSPDKELSSKLVPGKLLPHPKLVDRLSTEAAELAARYPELLKASTPIQKNTIREGEEGRDESDQAIDNKLPT